MPVKNSALSTAAHDLETAGYDNDAVRAILMEVQHQLSRHRTEFRNIVLDTAQHGEQQAAEDLMEKLVENLDFETIAEDNDDIDVDEVERIITENLQNKIGAVASNAADALEVAKFQAHDDISAHLIGDWEPTGLVQERDRSF